jgi:hypothetical protein
LDDVFGEEESPSVESWANMEETGNETNKVYKRSKAIIDDE